MEHKRILPILAGILAVSCLVLGFILGALNRKTNYLPDSSVDSLVSILAEDNISLDRSIISTKLSDGAVYLCASEDYEKTVAELLDGDEVEATYVVPDGQIITMEDGALFIFGEDFSFEYHKDGVAGEIPNLLDNTYLTGHLNEKKYAEISSIATEFLDKGSREFKTEEKMSVVTEIQRIAEKDGRYYVVCSRSIDGVEITENTVLCTIYEGQVIEAYGTWCFLTLDKSYSAQLSDILNILFNVKKEIVASKSVEQNVTVTAIEDCYALYFFGEEDEFCLIPCRKIVTDTMGEFIYNAIDGTLYTKN